MTSIVIITQVFPKPDVYTRIEEHFVDKCNKPKPPTLIITGDSHPREYCMTKADEKSKKETFVAAVSQFIVV